MANGLDVEANAVALYESSDGEVQLSVKLDEETIWLTSEQMCDLFDRDKSTVSRHLKNIFESGELDRGSTVAKTATVQREGDREVKRDVDYYNLDVVISLGYRVKSARGIQFRRWATRTLREHLVKGYTLNERRLEQSRTHALELENAVKLMRRALTAHNLVTDEADAMLDVITRYARSWQLLLQYDENRLPEAPTQSPDEMKELTVEAARAIITELKAILMARGEASELFGRERGEGLDGIIGNIEQTFGGEALYPSIVSRAAHLLYFVIKDHPFSDGNKRIGSLLFVRYLDLNGRLDRADGRPLVDDNALVALALLIAESDPGHKELLIRLIQNLMAEADDAGGGARA